jgi:integrase
MTGSIKPHPKGGYELRYREGGRGSTERKLRFRTRRQAEAALLAAQNRRERRKAGLPVEEGNITLGELADLFLAQYAGRPQSKLTLEYRLRSALARFGRDPVRQITPTQIASWYASLDGLADSTRRNTLKALRQLLDAAEEWGHVAVNPARRFRVSKGGSQPTDVRPFESWAEVEAVAGKAGRYEPLILFVCASGLRPQEWAALEWRDVDLGARTVTIRRTIQAGEVSDAIAKTRHSLRTVLLQDRALDALRQLPRPLRHGQPVFTDASGKRIVPSSFRRNVFEKTVTAAGLEKRSPKDMRHTFATLSLLAGASLAFVAKQLGHTDIKTTLDYYVRWLPAMDERELETLNAAASASPVRHTEAANA